MIGARTYSAYFLVGPTGTGKTAVAHFIAQGGPYEIVSADSMLVYRGMDIGTAKPSALERAAVPYHGIDLVGPGRRFSVAEYRRSVLEALPGIAARGRRAIVVGGTGLYVQALLGGLRDAPPASPRRRARWERALRDGGVGALAALLERAAPQLYRSLPDPRNPRRLIRALEMSEAGAREAPRTWGPAAAAGAPLAGLAMEPAALNSAIEARVRRMYDGGLLDEVRRLLDAGGLSQTALQAIGYAEAADALAGQCTVAVAQERTIARTRRLAKRQRTWFRRQASVAWIEAGGAEAVAETARRVVEHWTRHGPREIAG